MSDTTSSPGLNMDDKNSPMMTSDDRGHVPALAVDGLESATDPEESSGRVTAKMSDYFTLLASGFGAW